MNTDTLPNTGVKSDSQLTKEEDKIKIPPPKLIKNNKEPVMITLTAVDLNPARLLQRIQRGGDRLFPE